MNGEVHLRKNSNVQSMNGKAPFDVETIIKVDKFQFIFCYIFAPSSNARLKSLSVPKGYVIIDKFYRIVPKIVLKLSPRFS